MDFEDIIFGIYVTVCLIFSLTLLIVGIYTIATGNTNSNTNDYQKCICEKGSEE